MAQLFRVKILSVEGSTFEAELVSLIEEAGTADETKTFALNLVVELFWRLTELDSVSLIEGPAERGKEVALVPEVTEQLRAFKALSNGVELVVTPEEYALARRDDRHAGKALRGTGMSRRKSADGSVATEYRVSIEGDWDAFVVAAEKAVRSVAITDRRNHEAFSRWPDRDYTPDAWNALFADPVALAAYRERLPHTRLRVELDPATRAPFILEGMVWESTVHR